MEEELPEPTYYDNGQKKSEVIRNKDGTVLATSWYENGRKEDETICNKDGTPQRITGWHENGQKSNECNWKGNKLHGLTTSWYENGQKQEEGTWIASKNPGPSLKDGIWTEWDKKGNITKQHTYKDGKNEFGVIEPLFYKATSLTLFIDNKWSCQSRLKMSDGAPCYIAVAQTGVLVKKSKRGFMGAVLFEEKNTWNVAMVAKALGYLFPNKHYSMPPDMTNPVLRVFTNAVLFCLSLEEVSRVLNTAVKRAEQYSGKTIDEIEGTQI